MADEDRQTLVAAVEAINVHRRGLERVFALGHAFEVLQNEAMMRSNSNNPIGIRYNEAYASLERPVALEPGEKSIDKTSRNQFIWCRQRHEAIERWW
jgi:hypothetical protein